MRRLANIVIALSVAAAAGVVAFATPAAATTTVNCLLGFHVQTTLTAVRCRDTGGSNAPYRVIAGPVLAVYFCQSRLLDQGEDGELLDIYRSCTRSPIGSPEE
ncbi:hypothetical protein [Actinocorallia longicatena]|uniref:Secreted protein n=1 Tax=Actinocorallia longicatena TaxID=111803 RepID=A0ABP6QD89_9ACTN